MTRLFLSFFTSLGLAMTLYSGASAQVETAKRVDKIKNLEAAPLVVKPSKLPPTLQTKPALATKPLSMTRPPTTGWPIVGTPNFKPVANDQIGLIAATDGTVYMTELTTFDRVGAGMRNELQVTRFNGTSWSEVGDILDDVNRYSLALDSQGTLHVAVKHDVWPPHYSAIEVFKLVGGTWQRLGTTSIKGGTRAGAGMVMSIDRATDDIYLAHGNGQHEVMPRDTKMSVLKYDRRGQWLPVGADTVTPGGARNISLAAKSGRVLISYSDQTKDGELTVQEWKNQSWVPLGNTPVHPSATRGEVRFDNQGHPMMIIDPDGYGEKTLSSWKSGQWTEFATTPPHTAYVTLDKQDRPVVLIRGQIHAAHQSRVDRLEGSTWKPLGEAMYGFGQLRDADGQLYLGLVFPKDGPDWETVTWDQMEALEAQSEAENWDRRRHVTVRRYTQGVSSIKGPQMVNGVKDYSKDKKN